jgi:hypothetical protein
MQQAPDPSGSRAAATRALRSDKLLVRITSADMVESRSHVIYTLEVRQQSRVWLERKRYSEFRILYEELSRQFGKTHVPPCPSRTLLPSSAPDFIQRRKIALQQWLDNVVRVDSLRDSSGVATFLNVMYTQPPTRLNLNNVSMTSAGSVAVSEQAHAIERAAGPLPFQESPIHPVATADKAVDVKPIRPWFATGSDEHDAEFATSFLSLAIGRFARLRAATTRPDAAHAPCAK